MEKIKNWIIRQDFIDLIKKISYIDVPLFALLIGVSWLVYGELSFTFIITIIIGSVLLSLLYAVPIIIHQKGRK